MLLLIFLRHGGQRADIIAARHAAAADTPYAAADAITHAKIFRCCFLPCYYAAYDTLCAAMLDERERYARSAARAAFMQRVPARVAIAAIHTLPLTLPRYAT